MVSSHSKNDFENNPCMGFGFAIKDTPGSSLFSFYIVTYMCL